MVVGGGRSREGNLFGSDTARHEHAYEKSSQKTGEPACWLDRRSLPVGHALPPGDTTGQFGCLMS